MKSKVVVTFTSSIASILVSLMFSNQPTAAVTLGSLLNGGSFSSGNLLFDQFTFTPTSSGGTSSPTSADQINLTPISTANGYGLEFQSNFSTTVGAYIFDTISYRVQVLTPGNFIQNIQLRFNGTVPTSDSVASVSELVNNSSSTPVAAIDVAAPTNLSNIATLSSPQSTLRVNKSIFVVNSGKISLIDQLYTGGGAVSVPEPTLTMDTIAIGALLAGYLLMRPSPRGEG